MKSTSQQRELILWTIAMSLIGIVVVIGLYVVRSVLLIIYVSTLLAIGFSPAIRLLQGRRMGGGTGRRLPRWAAILIFYLALIALITLISAIVVPLFVAQFNELWKQLPTYVDRARAWLLRYRIRTPAYFEFLRTLPSPYLPVAAVLGAVQTVAGAAGVIVALVVLPLYMLVEADRLKTGVLKLVPPERRPWLARMIGDVTSKVGAWLGGQMLLCSIITVTASFGLWLFNVPYFYVLGLIAGAGEFVPVFGPFVAAIPSVLVALTVSFKTAVFVAIYFTVQQLIEGNVLVPRIMQRQVGVSAVAVITSLLIGSELLGFVGALLAVPTAAIVQVFLQEYLDRDEA